jgi:hypothetical protein
MVIKMAEPEGPQEGVPGETIRIRKVEGSSPRAHKIDTAVLMVRPRRQL